MSRSRLVFRQKIGALGLIRYPICVIASHGLQEIEKAPRRSSKIKSASIARLETSTSVIAQARPISTTMRSRSRKSWGRLMPPARHMMKVASALPPAPEEIPRAGVPALGALATRKRARDMPSLSAATVSRLEHYKEAPDLAARRVVLHNTSIGRVAFQTIPTILDVSIKSLPMIAADVGRTALLPILGE